MTPTNAPLAPPVGPEAVLTTEELSPRASRPPDYQAESRALVSLAEAMATSPETILQKLVEAVVELCRADSAGVSILEPGENRGVLRWRAAAGRLAHNAGGTMPLEDSPCGVILERNATLLFERPWWHFRELAWIDPPVYEKLVAPFHAEGKPIGTVWAISHTPERTFDAEDARVLESLSQFASAAWQTITALEAARTARDELEQRVEERTQELETSEERRLVAIEAAGIGDWIFEVPTGELKLSRHGLAMQRMGPDEPCDLERHLQLIHPQDRASVRRAVERATDPKGDGRYRSEFRFLFEDGEVRWIDSIGRARFAETAEGRRATHVFGAMIDVTARKCVEAALRESEERLRLALRAARMGVWTWDPAGDIQNRDANLNRLLGLEPKETTQPLSEFLTHVHPEDREGVRAAFENSVRQGRSLSTEFRVIPPDGTVRWLRDQGDVFRQKDAPASRMAGACVDITERKQAEEALRRSRDTFYDLVQNTPFGVYIVDSQFRLRQVSGGAQKVFSTVRPLIGRDFAEVLRTIWDEPFASEALGRFRHTLETGEPYIATETTERRHDIDDIESYDWRIERITLPDGEFGVVCYFYDLTERRRIEQALRESQERLGELNATLEQRVEERTRKLRESEERLRALALQLTRAEQQERRRLSLVLHDHLQQMIIGAEMHFGIAAPDVQRPEQEEVLRKGLEILGEALQTCRSLAVELSPPLLHDQGLGPALSWLAGRMQENHRLQVEFCGDDSVNPRSEELRELLFQSTRELLFNVVKHAASAETELRLTRDGAEWLCLEVEDEGAGFDPESPDIEERSRQSFGLFHMRERVEAIGGKLEVESAPGRGTRVRIIVPDAPEDLETGVGPEAIRTAAPGPARKPEAGLKGAIRILVVEDHTIVREGLVAVLERQPDFEVIGEAVNGKQAVEVCRDLEPDVVLMDVSLPEINGIAATRQITTSMPEVRVIGLSAHEDEMAPAMLEAGAVQYFTKGGPSEQLIGAIRGVARRSVSG